MIASPPAGLPGERRVEPARSEQMLRTKLAIAERLRRACAHLEQTEFDALCERMAFIEIKYAMRAADFGGVAGREPSP